MSAGWELAFEFFWLFFKALFSYNILKECVFPMHAWVIGEWCFFLLMLSSLCFHKKSCFEMFIGITFVVFVLWTLIGFFGFIASLAKTSHCMKEENMGWSFGLFFFVVIGIPAVCFIVHVKQKGCPCSRKVRPGSKQAVTEAELMEMLQKVLEGKEKAAAIDTTWKDKEVREPKLFPREWEYLIANHSTLYKASEYFHGLTRSCLVCKKAFNENDPIVMFPESNTPYHSECLKAHLKTSNDCLKSMKHIRESMYKAAELRCEMRKMRGEQIEMIADPKNLI